MGAVMSTRVESNTCSRDGFDANNNQDTPAEKVMPVAEDESSTISGEESDEEEEEEDDDDAEYFKERLQILEESRQLRQFAEFFLCPEKPADSDAAATARCYFSRYSAPQQESEFFDTERDQILEDMRAMKKLATDYLHPELPVRTTDPFACGRSYFDRPSAPTSPDDYEKDLILEDMKAMKKLARDFLHPELPVKTTDPFACGRSYFDRPSAPTSQDDYEKELILEDMKAMKKLAMDFLHPELPVQTTDPFACGRSYFDRPSAPTSQDEYEKDLILEDMKAMKKLAMDYLHPELPVQTTDPFACGRSYFDRPSAQLVSDEEMEEQYTILEDLRWMKTLADGYLHPDVKMNYSGFESEDCHFIMDEDLHEAAFEGCRPLVQNGGNQILKTAGHGPVQNMAFSPDCVMMIQI